MSDLRNHLQESHRDLTQWFLLHQECLLFGDDTSAHQAFVAFTDYLMQHMQFENEVVLTAMQAVESDLHWKLSLYHKEHLKIEQLLAKLQKKLQGYYALQGRVKRLALLEVLDDEQTFKHVMEHHEQREEKDLFLYLSEVLSEKKTDRWRKIEAGLESQYSNLKQSLKQMLEEEV